MSNGDMTRRGVLASATIGLAGVLWWREDEDSPLGFIPSDEDSDVLRFEDGQVIDADGESYTSIVWEQNSSLSLDNGDSIILQ